MSAEAPPPEAQSAIDALAFATDAESEAALHEGFSHLPNPWESISIFEFSKLHEGSEVNSEIRS